jgi:hypothetical protein
MMHLANVTTMGETSWGTVGGNNRSHDLVNGLSIRLPMMALLDINQNHIEDVGISPNIQVPFINDGSDNVLIRAFAHLGVTVTDSSFGGSNPGGNVYDVKVKPTLDSTGTHLTLEFTFYVNEEKQDDTFAPILDDKDIFEQYAGVGITIETSESPARELISDTQEYYADRVIADYTFDKALDPDIGYFFTYQGISDERNPMPDELMEELKRKYGDWMVAIEWYIGPINGGQPVHFERAGDTAPSIMTTTLPNGTLGASYRQTLNATGTTPITWSIDSGTLPTGLNLSGSTISGTPTTAGTSTFTVKAANGIVPDATRQLSITVNATGNGSGSGGGGCNAVFGLFGLLPLAVWVARKRMAA